MTTVLVSGALANKPGNGGGAWERLSWVVGLRRLGLDVYFIEQLDNAAEPSANLDWFRTVTQWFGVADRSHAISSPSPPPVTTSGRAGWTATFASQGVRVNSALRVPSTRSNAHTRSASRVQNATVSVVRSDATP